MNQYFYLLLSSTRALHPNEGQNDYNRAGDICYLRCTKLQTNVAHITIYNNTNKKIVEKCYIVVSDHLQHDANAIATYIFYFLESLKKDLTANHIVYVSDGCGGQYKNYKNFLNLLSHESDHGIKAEWHFAATAHGKNACDAVGGAVKAAAKRFSLKPNRLIRDSKEFYTFCSENMTSPSLCCLYVSSDQINEYVAGKDLATRYATGGTIPGKNFENQTL